ncbi:rRNA maturation RNase YbeY [Salipiger mucosus]|uniref:Endoribonuclease YbeY n=1 Tax=Salipiger mucosus DSM 16094 TaxID=1123237 RepID=S9QJD2_9RHOB|nr:rRNA maturation RNase YbeY [Salipiger mucosus]EPX79678.1 Metal-dependent hydrolase YbeY, involved in rRNA and/or ribosome maturation and assembly [Salipiger mucosus DSM 16094]
MLTDTILEDDRWAVIDLEALAESAARAALSHLGIDPEAHEIVVLGCDDARIATLNADFRDKPRPTNVLSWPSEERAAAQDGGCPEPPEPGMPGDPAELGDIALAWETCAREAAEAGKTPADHVTHLVVHGTLHLLGYDHERDADATLMETLETKILGKLGVADPYG